MIAPIWTDAANDARCRGWAREVAALFKGELERTGRETGKGVGGGVGVRGSEGAVMMYGNYDREFCVFFAPPPPPPLFFDFCFVSAVPFFPFLVVVVARRIISSFQFPLETLFDIPSPPPPPHYPLYTYTSI